MQEEVTQKTIALSVNVGKGAETTDNPKYTMRCYLLRLGMIGAKYKSARKALLRNLSGSSAFRKAANDEVSE